MAANAQTGREFVAFLARHYGWQVSTDGYTDTYIWPHLLDLGEGVRPLQLAPNTATWDETGMLVLDFDGEPLTAEETQEFSRMSILVETFTKAFTDPFGVDQVGIDKIKELVEEGDGSYRLG